MVNVQVFSPKGMEYRAKRNLLKIAPKAKDSSRVSVSTRLPSTNKAVSPALNTGLSCFCSAFCVFEDLEELEEELFSDEELDEGGFCDGFSPSIFSCWGWVFNKGR